MTPGLSLFKSASPLRRRILSFVGALVVLSLLGSTVSLFRITGVNRLLDGINRVSVPLGRLFSQLQSDAEIYRRELDRSLGASHWNDPHWSPRPVPKWIEDILDGEVGRVDELLRKDAEWVTDSGARSRWREWSKGLREGFAGIREQARSLQQALSARETAAASRIHATLIANFDAWKRELRWGATEYERAFRETFSLAQGTVEDLRTGLEIVLGVVVLLSMLLLWLGERALRPLAELTALAREITRRGLRREDKELLPAFPISRSDEVSQLGREFHNMATALLERERTVEAQKSRLQDQNRLLREIGELNSNILRSIESVLIVTDLQGVVTQCNPGAARWLEADAHQVIGTRIGSWPRIRSFLPEEFPRVSRGFRLEPARVESRVFGGHLMPLRHETGELHGAILVLEDLTAELDLQERLRRAENLAAIGRMSAQVAHEVRNPLHSIGLEAEIAAELAGKSGDGALKQSVQSILSSVDRLEKITENYLKLSRLSAGKKAQVDPGEVLETVLATYATALEAQRVRVDWRRESEGDLRIWADRDLLEQVLGNLLRNSLQALEGAGVAEPRIEWSMGRRRVAEDGRVWLRISDNGPGISKEIRDKLFTPFVTTRAQGTGLGLSFVKKVVEEHEGAIASLSPSANGVDTGAEGMLKGACFELTFPALEASGPRPAPEVAHP